MRHFNTHTHMDARTHYWEVECPVVRRKRWNVCARPKKRSIIFGIACFVVVQGFWVIFSQSDLTEFPGMTTPKDTPKDTPRMTELKERLLYAESLDHQRKNELQALRRQFEILIKALQKTPNYNCRLSIITCRISLANPKVSFPHSRSPKPEPGSPSCWAYRRSNVPSKAISSIRFDP